MLFNLFYCRILDVFDLHRGRLRALNRRIFLNENCPIDDCFGEDSSSVIHCRYKHNLQ